MNTMKTANGAYVSRFDGYCEGASDPSRYVVLLNAAAAKVPARFGGPLSGTLDEIVAFDRAEVARMNMGQINLIEVSSFCGPGGLIWGYDLARSESLRSEPLFDLSDGDRRVPVFEGRFLAEAAGCLLGTTDRRMFPLRPGTLCPAAFRSAVCRGPGIACTAFGIGITADRSSAARIFMEDGGAAGLGTAADKDRRRLEWAERVAGSILAVAANQRQTCTEIFVLYDEIEVGEGEVGCALSLVPYVKVAKRAIPRKGMERLKTMRLGEWLREVGSRRV